MVRVIAILFVLCAAPAFAQQSVVEKYRGNYPTPMSADQKVDLLRHVAVDVHGGLLLKPDGTSCGGYACDVICFSDAVLFDVLTDQDNAAKPSWNQTSNPRGYRCELVAVMAPPSQPGPPTTNPPSISVDLSAVLARLDLLVAKVDAHDAGQERIYADETNQHHDQTTQILAAVNEPAFISKLVKNPYFQVIVASAVTFFTTHQVMK